MRTQSIESGSDNPFLYTLPLQPNKNFPKLIYNTAGSANNSNKKGELGKRESPNGTTKQLDEVSHDEKDASKTSSFNPTINVRSRKMVDGDAMARDGLHANNDPNQKEKPRARIPNENRSANYTGIDSEQHTGTEDVVLISRMAKGLRVADKLKQPGQNVANHSFLGKIPTAKEHNSQTALTPFMLGTNGNDSPDLRCDRRIGSKDWGTDECTERIQNTASRNQEEVREVDATLTAKVSAKRSSRSRTELKPCDNSSYSSTAQIIIDKNTQTIENCTSSTSSVMGQALTLSQLRQMSTHK